MTTSTLTLPVPATVSLNSILAHNPCASVLDAFKAHFGHLDPDAPVPLISCLKSNSVPYVIWALRAVHQDISGLLPLIAADFAESVLHIFEENYPNDDRPRKAIEAARGTDEEKALAAAEAAYAADAADAANAAYAAAYAAYATDAANAANAAAAYAAARAANAATDADAYAAEHSKQAEILRKYFTET